MSKNNLRPILTKKDQTAIRDDFLEFAKKVKVKKKIDPVKAREYMEKNYDGRKTI